MSNLEKYLKLLGQQDEVKEEEITIKRNVNLEDICKSYERWINEYKGYYGDDYKRAFDNHPKQEYSSKDIEDFSLELLKYQNRKHFENTGLFLSALINKSKAQEFTIITEHLDKKINLIGYENKKIANVKGDAGDYVGYYNKGTVTVGGDAGDYVGYYNKGTVTVEGNAGYCVGWYNEGTVKINGKIKSLSGYTSGKIYQGGKLIKWYLLNFLK